MRSQLVKLQVFLSQRGVGREEWGGLEGREGKRELKREGRGARGRDEADARKQFTIEAG